MTNYESADDYLSRAYAADQKAATAKEPEVAESWRIVAEDYRTLAWKWERERLRQKPFHSQGR